MFRVDTYALLLHFVLSGHESIQTNLIKRNVYVEPPREAGIPRGKVWKLKPPAYGLIDAAHSFFLNYPVNLIAFVCIIITPSSPG